MFVVVGGGDDVVVEDDNRGYKSFFGLTMSESTCGSREIQKGTSFCRINKINFWHESNCMECLICLNNDLNNDMNSGRLPSLFRGLSYGRVSARVCLSDQNAG